MGVNFYALTNVCSSCGRSDERVHIGKCSVGWRFTFRGYRNEEDAPLEFPITVAAHWRKVLSKRKVRIVDEYGYRVKPKDFWAMVEAKQDGKISGLGQTHGWVDPAGYVFVDEQFC